MDNEKIEQLVSNYFYLKPSSNFRFSESLRNPFIDSMFKEYVDEENRIKIELPVKAYENFDKGWDLLRAFMPGFINYYHIRYDDFRKNKIFHQKNTFKIIKLMKSYFITSSGQFDEDKIDEYLSLASHVLITDYGRLYTKFKEEYDSDMKNVRLLHEVISNFIDKINEVRFSTDKNMSIVISFNFKDIFLSSTGEDWSSCLNLESRSFAAYWASLPGAVVDKNFGVLYVTNESEKYYEQLVAPKMLSRSYFLLDKDDNINIIKFYPNELISLSMIKNLFPFNIKYIDKEFISKYNINPLKYKNNLTCYIYQDKTIPVVNNDGTFHLRYGKKGLHTIAGHASFEGPIFNYSGGFQRLKDLEKDLGYFEMPPTTCRVCGIILSASRALRIDDDPYCQTHYDQAMKEREDNGYINECSECGVLLLREEDVRIYDDMVVCPLCYDML